MVDEKEKERVSAGHKDLGEYKILVSKVLSNYRARSLAESLNNMSSSSKYPKLFKTFEYQDERLGIGYVVKRKVLLGDRLSLLEAYENKIKCQRGKTYRRRIRRNLISKKTVRNPKTLTKECKNGW